MMIDYKPIIFSKISELTSQFTDLNVYQRRPEVIAEFPTVTFYLIVNSPDYDLDKEIGRQNVTVVIDIWTETSSEGAAILAALEEKMKEINYLLSDSPDILDPDGGSHIVSTFIY